MRVKTEDKVYNFVCENPGLSTYEISKKLKMTGGRVRYTLSKLKSFGLIKFKFERKSARVRKLSYPVNAWDLLPKPFKQELKKMI